MTTERAEVEVFITYGSHATATLGFTSSLCSIPKKCDDQLQQSHNSKSQESILTQYSTLNGKKTKRIAH